MSDRFAVPAQAESGAFLSDIEMPSGVRRDENSFVTALVCEALFPWKNDPRVAAAISGGLEFIKSCASRNVPGAFGFWPEGGHPHWLARALPPDTDDTAICHSILSRFDPAWNIGEAVTAIAPSKIVYLDERSRSWHQVGGFETWIDEVAVGRVAKLVEI